MRTDDVVTYGADHYRVLTPGPTEKTVWILESDRFGNVKATAHPRLVDKSCLERVGEAVS